MATHALVSIGQTLAQKGFANPDRHEPGVSEADAVASSLQFASRSNATEDDGPRAELRTAGELKYTA
jgi:hypothetical protein